MQIRSEVTNVFTQSASNVASDAGSDELIEVSEATRRVAFAYERFRNTLEPEEEDILRRGAIGRILERRMLEDRPARVVAEQVLQELMRANYIEPVRKSFVVWMSQQIERAREVHRRIPHELHSWFLGIVAVVIDRGLFPRAREEAMVQLMYHDTFRRTTWIDTLVAEPDRATQLYMGCHRALFEADDYEIAYHYFIAEYPAWGNHEFGENEARQIGNSLASFYTHVQRVLAHPERDRITRLLRPVAVPYRILRDVLEHGAGVPESTEALEGQVREIVEDKERRLRGRMNRRAWHSILFLFFTKTILAFLIEVPYEVFLLDELHVAALLVNIGFHPLLLFVSATSVRFPGSANTNMIVDQVRRIVQGEELPTVVLGYGRHYGPLTWSFFALIYGVLFLLLFWALFSILALLGFSLVAMFMFIIFLGLVSFLATRIRHTVRELRIVRQREGAFGSFVTFMALPVVEFGRWLAINARRFNIPLILMDRVLEAPFKLLIDVLEEWFSFVRDRREELV